MLKNSVGESFTVALISVTEKVWIRGREFQDNPSKTFCLTVPNISVGESFTVALLSCIEKIWIRGGGEYQDFPSKLFCLLVPKIFVEESFTVAVMPVTGSVWIRRGVSRFSVENILSQSAEKLRRGILYCCLKFLQRKSLDKKGGNIKNFRRKIFVSQCRKVT